MHRHEHAVVLGAGLAGLLAARALSEQYERVSILERDPLPSAGEGRRGVPQGRHAHVLMPRGAEILEEFFPGFVTQMVDDGAVLTEPLLDYRANVGGRDLLRVPIGGSSVQASRPFLERHVRDRVLDLAETELVDGCDVVGLLTADSGGAVTGVRVLRRTPGSAEESIKADLVVDAMGRGGRTPAWLDSLGYPRPVEDRPKVDLTYATQVLRLPRGTHVDPTVMTGPVPGHPRGMVMVEVEEGLRQLTLAGFGAGNRAPVDPEGFLGFAATVAPPDVFAAIRDADPLSDIAGYRFPTYQRRRYDRLRRHPTGLLVTGDALCSFSPIYAQGMTVAGLQAMALRTSLERGTDGLARRFYAAAAKVVEGPWRMALAADLALPEIKGRRTAAVRVLNAYVARVLAASEHDAAVSRQFMRVTSMLDAPERLFRPSIAWRALRRSPAHITGAGTAPNLDHQGLVSP